MEIQETNRNKWIFYLIILGLVLILISILTCNGNKDTVLAKTPETKGITPISKPEQKPIVIFQDSVVFKYIQITSEKDYNYWQSEARRLLNEYNDLDEAFRNSNDSLQQLLYASATKPNEFFNEWDNDTLNAKVFGLNSGEIHSMQLKYTIKERKQEVKVKNAFNIYAGGQIGSNKTLNQFTYKVDLSGAYKKNIYTASYQRMFNNDIFLFGVQRIMF